MGAKLKRLLWGKEGPVELDVLTGYARWAKKYPAKAHNPLMEIEEQAMLSLLPDDLSDRRCLDLACGSGRYLLLMQTHRARQIFGMDISAHMLQQAKTTDTQFKLARSPFIALPFASASFDLITCGLAVGHEKNLDQVLAEVARLLRPGGAIIYSDFHPFGTLVGWQRSFTTETGATFSIEHHLHLYRDHQRACRQGGLTIEAVREPSANEHVPARLRDMPVVLVIRAVKETA